MFLGYWSVRIKRGKVQIEQEQNKKDRREQKKEERRQMLVCDCCTELKMLVGIKPFVFFFDFLDLSVKSKSSYYTVLKCPTSNVAKQQTTCSSLSSF